MQRILRLAAKCFLGQALLLTPCLAQHTLVQPAPTPSPAPPQAKPTTPLIVSANNSPCYSTVVGTQAICTTGFTCSNNLWSVALVSVNVYCPGHAVVNVANTYATVGASQAAGNGSATIYQGTFITFPLLSEYILVPCTTGKPQLFITFTGPCPNVAPSCPVMT